MARTQAKLSLLDQLAYDELVSYLMHRNSIGESHAEGIITGISESGQALFGDRLYRAVRNAATGEEWFEVYG